MGDAVEPGDRCALRGPQGDRDRLRIARTEALGDLGRKVPGDFLILAFAVEPDLERGGVIPILKHGNVGYQT